MTDVPPHRRASAAAWIRWLTVPVLLAALAAAVVSGPAQRAPGRHVTVLRIADELAGSREAPHAVVGDVTRYVLTELPVDRLRLLTPFPATVGESGAVAMEIECPQSLAGQRLLVHVTLSSPPAGPHQLSTIEQEHAEEIQCPVGHPPRVEIRVRGLTPGITVFATASGHSPPARHVTTPWLQLLPSATLALAIGIADPRARGDRVGGRFRIRAEGRGGRMVDLLARTLEPAGRSRDGGWTMLDVPLDRLAALGAEVRLHFTTEALGADDAFVFPAWGDPTIVAPAPPDAQTSPPSVLLVSLDTLRADRLGCYGFPQPTSPNLDRFATEGTLFEHAIAQATWTLPSHATMLTGVNPCVHGFRSVRHPQADRERMPGAIVPLAELLRRRGYATAAFTENAFVSPAVFQRGFGVFRANPAWEGGVIEDTFASAIAWLRRHADQPFLLFVHTYQVHAPYDPPARYASFFPADALSGGAPVLPPSATAAADAAAYAAEVRYTDDALGTLFAALDRLRLTERTIVVVTSDHGEAFGEHGHRYHGGGVFEEDIRVPLIWRAPGLITSGRVISEVVGLVDIVPTVLDLLGMAIPAWIQGESLKALLVPDGNPTHRLRSPVRFSRTMLGLQAMRGRSWKAVLRYRSPSVFFLRQDPQELHPQKAGALARVIERLRRRHEADCRRVRLLLERTPAAASAPSRYTHGPKEERKLRALGYVE